MKVNRRELLKNAAFVSGAMLVGASWPPSKKLFAQDVLLDLPNLPSPADSGIEHIVVVTMENLVSIIFSDGCRMRMASKSA
jgi:hypothetical protein